MSGRTIGMRNPSSRDDLIRVGAQSEATKVAGSIAHMIRAKSVAEVRAIGAAAVNEAAKSIAIAHSYLSEDGIAIYTTIRFEDIEIEGGEKTALRFIVRKFNRREME